MASNTSEQTVSLPMVEGSCQKISKDGSTARDARSSKRRSDNSTAVRTEAEGKPSSRVQNGKPSVVREESSATFEMETQIPNSRQTVPHLLSKSARALEYQQKVRDIKTALCQSWDQLNSMTSGYNLMASIQSEHVALNEELRKCHAELETLRKDRAIKISNIERLQDNAQALEAANVKLEQRAEKIQQQLSQERAGLGGSYVDNCLTPFLLESAAKDVFSTISTFASLYSKYKSFTGSVPARSLADFGHHHVLYITRHHHWIFVLKSVISEVLFRNFESETFMPSRCRMYPWSNTALFLNHEEMVRSCFAYFEGSRPSARQRAESGSHARTASRFDSLWLDYLNSVSVEILPPESLWILPFFNEYGEIVQPVKVGGWAQFEEKQAEELNVVKSFIIAAKSVWDFHKLCLSFEPRATIFRVAVGEPFNNEYMDSSVTLGDDEKFISEVGFMIHPGFRLRKTVIKCGVYFGV